MSKPYDKSELAHFDISLRSIVERNYELCIYRCNEEKDKP